MYFIYHTNRSILKLRGKDVRSFLQGLVTNDLDTLTSKTPLYTLLLSSGGRYQFDFFLYQEDKDIYLDVSENRVDELKKRLSLYKLRADVTLAETEGLARILTIHDSSDDFSLAPDPRTPELGRRGIVWEDAPSFLKGGREESMETYDLLRIKLGVPEDGYDLIPDKTIPLEANMDGLNAISFTKGCYLGQELTSRTKHTGIVRKRLFPVTIKGEIPAEDKTLFSGDQAVGTLTSHKDGLGIALVRLEVLETPLHFSNGTLIEVGSKI